MKKVLWLSSWYPNRIDPLVGDFIERHARATATCHQVFLIHVLKANWQSYGNTVEFKSYPENLRAKIIYYNPGNHEGSLLGKARSNIRLFNSYKKAIEEYIAEHGKPDLIHVHIAMKAGLMALYCLRKYNIPFVVSEQWSGLCPEAVPNFAHQSWLFRRCWSRIMRKASNFSAVSQYLSYQIQRQFSVPPGMIIPNVVDGAVFFPAGNGHDGFRFVHISTLKYQKNPEQMLQAASILHQKGIAFTLNIIGPRVPSLMELSESLGLRDTVVFMGEMDHASVATELRNNDALILYSRFETFGCVIIEANASGIPVIVSDIPVMQENVSENVNGSLVPLDRPDLLAGAMEKMVNNRSAYDPETLAAAADERYAFKKVGLLFDKLYHL